jgi:hypothetical protein
MKKSANDEKYMEQEIQCKKLEKSILNGVSLKINISK